MQSRSLFPMKGRYLWIALLGVLLIFFIDHAGFFEGLNNHFYDLAFRIRGPQKPPSRILIAAIDEKTLNHYGRWPLSRRYYVKLLEQVAQADAVGFDLILAEPTEDDALLAEAMEKRPKVILPVYIDDQLNISYPAQAFSSARKGHIHLEQGIDGIVRNVFHTIVYEGKVLHSFAAEIYDLVGEQKVTHKESLVQAQPSIHDADIVQADLMTINYHGDHHTFPYMSLWDIIEGKQPPEFFHNKIILVGLTAKGLRNGILTPYNQARNPMPAVEVQAHILQNALDQTAIKIGQQWYIWCGVILLFSLSFWQFVRLGSIRAMPVWMISLGVIALGVYIVFSHGNLWVSPAAFFFAVTFAFILAYVYNLEHMGDLLRQAKDDWEESFNTISDAIIIFDQDDHIVRMNITAQETFEPSLLERLRQQCLDVFQSKRATSDTTDTSRDVSQGMHVTQEIFDSESEKHLEIKSHLRRNQKGQQRGMVHVIRDVTEQRKSEQEQQRLQSQLMQAQKMEAIGALAGGVAHDFNNILAAIMGYTELVTFKVPEDSSVRPQLEQVLTACERAKDLVHQILAFSRQTQHEKKPIQVGLIVLEVLKLLRASLPSSVEIRQHIMAKSSLVFADPTQIHQVLMNLCTNASHAMQENGGVLQVSLEDVDIDARTAAAIPDVHLGPHLKLSVRDTGHGIERKVLDHIFDPFFTTKGPGKGTGMGLAVVHGITKNHHGAIQVSSTSGEGSTFDIYLPRVTSPVDLKPEEKPSIPTGNERVLVVDDEPSLVDMWKQMIERLGYQVVAKISPEEAIQLFRDHPTHFDIVITDMTMPKMSGDVLACELMKIRPDIPVILCTGFSEQMTEEKAQSLGIKELLAKPLSINDLAKTIRRSLGDV